MIAEFDGQEIAGGRSTVKLTVCRNIADAGGLSCAEAAKKDNNVDLKASSSTGVDEGSAGIYPITLSIDVHAPNKLHEPMSK